MKPVDETHDAPTPYDDLNDVLATFRLALRDELGANFVGLYLQGSFAAGGFDEYSDCDWIVVVEEPVAPDAEAQLQAMHGRIFDLPSPWAQHLEGSYFPREVLRTLDPDAEPVLFLDNGSRALERSKHCDTLVTRWTLREHGIALAGPDLRTLVDPVDIEAMKDEVRELMRTWSVSLVEDPSIMGLRWFQVFAVVTHCRFLHTLATGVVGSKPAAVAWARGLLDARWNALVAQTVANRAAVYADPHSPADPRDLAETAEFVRHVLDRVSVG